eukprot:scaffold203470_cov30-Tisochrysis_lutea.AAC.2
MPSSRPGSKCASSITGPYSRPSADGESRENERACSASASTAAHSRKEVSGHCGGEQHVAFAAIEWPAACKIAD